MGSSSSKPVDSVRQERTVDIVRQEINEIIEKIKIDKKRLEEFIKNRKTTATDEWSQEKESEDKDQMRLTVESASSKKILKELNKEFDELQAAVAPAGAAAVPSAPARAAAVPSAPAGAAASFNTPNTQQIYNARNAPGPQDPNQPELSGFEYPSSDSDSVGGTMKRKNSKRKNSKRKNSKRKNSKRKNSKRK